MPSATAQDMQCNSLYGGWICLSGDGFVGQGIQEDYSDCLESSGKSKSTGHGACVDSMMVNDCTAERRRVAARTGRSMMTRDHQHACRAARQDSRSEFESEGEHVMQRTTLAGYAIALSMIMAPNSMGQIHTTSVPANECGCVSGAPVAGGCAARCCPRILPAIAKGIHGVLNSLLPCYGCGDPCPTRPVPPVCRTSYRPCFCLPLIPIISYRRNDGCGTGCLDDCDTFETISGRGSAAGPTPAEPIPGATEPLPPDLPKGATPPEDIHAPGLKPAPNPPRETRAWHTRTTSLPRGVSQLPPASTPVPHQFETRTVVLEVPIADATTGKRPAAPSRLGPIAARRMPHPEIRVIATTNHTKSGKPIPRNPLR